MSLGWRHWSVAFAVAVLLHASLLALRWGWNERQVQRSVVTLDLQTPDNLPDPVPVSLPSSLAFAWQLGAEPDTTRPLPDTPPPATGRGGALSATLGGQSLGLAALTGPAVAAAADLAASAPASQPAATPAPPPPRPAPPTGGVSAGLARSEPPPTTAVAESEEPAEPTAPVEPATTAAVVPGPAPPDQVRLVRAPDADEDEDEEAARSEPLPEPATAPVETPEDAVAQQASVAPALGLSDSLDLPSASEVSTPEQAPTEADSAPPTAEPAQSQSQPDRPSRVAELDQAIDQALAQTVQPIEPLDFPPPSTPTPPPAARAAPASGDVDRALSETLDQLARVRPESRSPPVDYRLPPPSFEPDPADQTPQRRAPNRNAEISRALTGVQSQFGRDERVPNLPPPTAAAPSPEARSGHSGRSSVPAPPQPPAAAAPNPGATPGPARGPAGTVSGRRADPRYDPNGRPGAYSVDANDFFSRIADHIFRANDRFIGRLPPDAPRVFLDVRFTIDRAGRVMTVDLLRSSGDARLDQAAREVIWRASPMPALAQDMVSETLELTFPVVVAR